MFTLMNQYLNIFEIKDNGFKNMKTILLEKKYIILCYFNDKFQIKYISFEQKSSSVELITQEQVMLTCGSSQQIVFPFYPFMDSLAILSCNTNPLNVIIFDKDFNMQFSGISITDDSYYYELVPLPDSSFFIAALKKSGTEYSVLVNKIPLCSEGREVIQYFVEKNKKIDVIEKISVSISSVTVTYIEECLCYANNINLININSVIAVQDGIKCELDHPSKAIITFSFENAIKTEICERIFILCVDNCEECDEDVVCNKCKNGYLLAISNNTKICLLSTSTDGYYKDYSDNIYKECSSTCETCSRDLCYSCKEGTTLNNYKCVFPYTCSNSSKILKGGNELIITPSLNGVTSFYYDSVNNSRITTYSNGKSTYKAASNEDDGYTETINYYALNGAIQASDICIINLIICGKGCETCDETSYCTTCENGYYIILTELTMQCVTDCKSTNNKFHIKDEFDCIEECPNNYNANSENECIKKTIPLTPPEGDEILYLLNQEIKGDDYVIQIYSTDSPPKISNNISTIDLGKCENVLRIQNNINNNEPLLIYKIDTIKSNSFTAIVDYGVYSSNGLKLDLIICNNLTIKVETPIVNTENIIKAKEFLDEKGVDIFNSDDTFFSDICIPYTDEKGNIILPDRNKDIFQNITLCSNGCTYDNVNYSTNKVLCQCNNKESKISFKVNEKEQFTKLNVKHIVCYKLLTKRKYVTNNLGFWFGLV